MLPARYDDDDIYIYIHFEVKKTFISHPKRIIFNETIYTPQCFFFLDYTKYSFSSVTYYNQVSFEKLI